MKGLTFLLGTLGRKSDNALRHSPNSCHHRNFFPIIDGIHVYDSIFLSLANVNARWVKTFWKRWAKREQKKPLVSSGAPLRASWQILGLPVTKIDSCHGESLDSRCPASASTAIRDKTLATFANANIGKFAIAFWKLSAYPELTANVARSQITNLNFNSLPFIKYSICI